MSDTDLARVHFDEVREVVNQSNELSLTILTLDQCPQPSKRRMVISREVRPDEFAELAEYARARHHSPAHMDGRRFE